MTSATERQNVDMVRDILFHNHAETMEEGEIRSFSSGHSIITLEKFPKKDKTKGHEFLVIYKPRDQNAKNIQETCYLWHPSTNTWTQGQKDQIRNFMVNKT